MSQYKTSAIILKTYDFKDFDKILVLYSKEKGLIRAIAKGVKKNKSSIGRLEPLMAVELVLYEGRNLDNINQSYTIDYFKNIRKDLKKITYAMCYAELTCAFGMENDLNASEYYEVLYTKLKKLENASDKDLIEHLLVDFQHKIISMAGYKPLFDFCNSCRRDFSELNSFYFSPKNSNFICDRCIISPNEIIEIDDKLYNYFVNIANENKELLNMDNETVLKAYSIMREYIKHKTNFKFKTSDLIEDICLNCG